MSLKQHKGVWIVAGLSVISLAIYFWYQQRQPVNNDLPPNTLDNDPLEFLFD